MTDKKLSELVNKHDKYKTGDSDITYEEFLIMVDELIDRFKRSGSYED